MINILRINNATEYDAVDDFDLFFDSSMYNNTENGRTLSLVVLSVVSAALLCFAVFQKYHDNSWRHHSRPYWRKIALS
jgi:hypothetical protein